jgi:hypothetical protein
MISGLKLPEAVFKIGVLIADGHVGLPGGCRHAPSTS